ncbi:hypothetical protein H9Q13_09125 [Pontibacter sp. JH31]|uniref:Carboxypeptidase regulatory-like domain-containing protein n=1 Tax=Pontibacter aquaedesilientis TaxID=2766980 RepID=A0ABR7XGB3_9BACT|nr:hypothetical protein [Pontibacter aquaedesilientis]MBD1397325.1 hypothetical protein [Pontibacter aquaedesilientis]
MIPHLLNRKLIWFFLLLLSSCSLESPVPTDVVIEGRITTDGGAKPMAAMWVKLIKDRPVSLDVNELTTKTDDKGFYRFKFKANHQLNERVYGLSYNISTADNDPYFCSSNYFRIGHLPSADTTLVYNFDIPRKTAIHCVYNDPVKAREFELNTIFKFTCGLVSDSNRFMNSTGAASMVYTENPLYIPAHTPVIAVTRGIDRKLNKALEQMDTIMVAYGTNYTHRIELR